MALLAASSCSDSRSGKTEYPAAPCDSTVYEVSGIRVEDPYRPLENDTAEATTEWVKAENAVTRAYIDKIPFRQAIHERLSRLNRYERNGLPWIGKDGRYYFSLNDGTRNQAVIYRCDSLGGDSKPEVFIDPNSLSDDGTVALTGISQSSDGKYTAYTISRNGSDWTEIYVMDTETGKLLPDHIEWAKFTGAEWAGDGFYYSAYPRPEAGKEFSNSNEYHSVYYHRLGTPQTADRVTFEDKNNPLHFHSARVADDESALFISIGGQGHGEALLAKDLRKGENAPWVTIEPTQDYENEIVGAEKGTVYLRTSDGAQRYRLVKVSLDNPKQLTEIIPEDSTGVLTSVKFAGPDHMIAVYDRDAASHAYVYDAATGRRLREIEFPTFGTAGFSSSKKHPEVFYSFSSFTYPSSIFSYDLGADKSELFRSSAIEGFNPDDYTTEQVFYTSKDGTKVPMFLVYKKGLSRDGKNPVYLYGYGGFNISLNPGFNPSRLLWLENGGIYAQANLRGGGEYGEEWHEAGTKMKKLNVFDDFIAAAEYLVDEKWTNPELITIEGGSNGGLLVGATVNLRPDLFKVAIPRVGVMDMMRYHLFTIGWNWAHDYGTSDDSPEMARYLLDYSPLHNISNDGTAYPAILVTTADHDDRVVPAHSFKYAAALQAADTGNAPKLIRIDSKAGHGAGKPISKVVDEYADIYSFIFENLGIEPTATIKASSAAK